MKHVSAGSIRFSENPALPPGTIQVRQGEKVLATMINIGEAPAPKPYGCHNQPRPVAGAVTHLAQSGYEEPVDENWGWFSRKPRYVEIHHTMSTDCRYDKSTTDPRCAGCQHISKEIP